MHWSLYSMKHSNTKQRSNKRVPRKYLEVCISQETTLGHTLQDYSSQKCFNLDCTAKKKEWDSSLVCGRTHWNVEMYKIKECSRNKTTDQLGVKVTVKDLFDGIIMTSVPSVIISRSSSDLGSAVVLWFYFSLVFSLLLNRIMLLIL